MRSWVCENVYSCLYLPPFLSFSHYPPLSQHTPPNLTLTTTTPPVLSIICTDPSHHGRGIAASLIRPVLALADKERIPAYLEALPLAVPLYQRLGFQPVDRLEYDLAKAGRRGKAVLTIMVREPQSESESESTSA